MNLNKKTQCWLAVFEQHKQSAPTIAGFSKNNNINVSSCYAWRKRLSEDVVAQLIANKKHPLEPLLITDSSTSNATLTLTLYDGTSQFIDFY